MARLQGGAMKITAIRCDGVEVALRCGNTWLDVVVIAHLRKRARAFGWRRELSDDGTWRDLCPVHRTVEGG